MTNKICKICGKPIEKCTGTDLYRRPSVTCGGTPSKEVWIHWNCYKHMNEKDKEELHLDINEFFKKEFESGNLQKLG